MVRIETALQSGDALIVVDVQTDFCPGGALPIEDGHAVISVINTCITAAVASEIPVYATRDWHPIGHISFQERGGDWPPHCIQDSEGARFHPELKLPQSAVAVSKGVRFDHDQYSAFHQTGLAAELRERGIKRIWVGGLAEDVCVLATVLDALGEGFELMVIQNATRPITPEGGEKARQEMQSKGARLVTIE